jgi:hypothetical protein
MPIKRDRSATAPRRGARRTSWIVAALALLLASLTNVAPAAAAQRHISDPAGDGEYGPRLDITLVQLQNRDHSILVRISFVRTSYSGSLAVFYLGRGDRYRDMVRVAIGHRRGGDKSRVDTVHGREPCKGLRVTWSDRADTADIRLPASCFHSGQYGSVAIRVLTEFTVDADYAPEGPRGNLVWSAWTRRG